MDDGGNVPVLIIGAGPVGLALANELGYRGVGYLQVDPSGRSATWDGGSYNLAGYYEQHATGIEGFVFAEATDDRELWPALKKFFAKEGVEAAVR